jgi:hypothetical protein
MRRTNGYSISRKKGKTGIEHGTTAIFLEGNPFKLTSLANLILFGYQKRVIRLGFFIPNTGVRNP